MQNGPTTVRASQSLSLFTGAHTCCRVQASYVVYADFMNYNSGIYEHQSGTSHGGHAVTLVGWGTENGKNYWKAQNSWGPYWGYFRLELIMCNARLTALLSPSPGFGEGPTSARSRHEGCTRELRI